MLILERKFAPKLKVNWIEHHMTWFCAYDVLCHYTHPASFIHVHTSSCPPWCIHEIHLVHIHAIGVPRTVVRAKLHKAWTPKLESVREPEVQSDGTVGNVGSVREAEHKVFLCVGLGKPRSIISLLLLKQLIIYVICIVALSGRSCLEPLLHYIIPCLDIWIPESYVDRIDHMLSPS
jgi:hypothetical protein